MTQSPANDPLLKALAGLPAAATESDRDERVLRRCHTLLAAQRRSASTRRGRVTPRPIESLIVGAFGLVYLLAILADAARAYGL